MGRSIIAGKSYGFVSRSAGIEIETLPGAIDEQFEGYPPPGNVFQLAREAFERNLRSIFAEIGRKDVSEKSEHLPLHIIIPFQFCRTIFHSVR